MVKNLIPDGDPVTKSFLIKALLMFIGFIILTLVPLTYQIGGMLATYNKLSTIPPSDIIKAIEYSVKNQPERKEFYRSYMEKSNLTLQSHESRIKAIEEWSRDIKRDIENMRYSIEAIEKTQIINTRVLVTVEDYIKNK